MEEIKKKAIYQTIGIFAMIVVCSLLFNLIVLYVPVEVLRFVFCMAFIGFSVWIIYGVVLERLKFNQKIDNLSSRDN